MTSLLRHIWFSNFSFKTTSSSGAILYSSTQKWGFHVLILLSCLVKIQELYLIPVFNYSLYKKMLMSSEILMVTPKIFAFLYGLCSIYCLYLYLRSYDVSSREKIGWGHFCPLPHLFRIELPKRLFEIGFKAKNHKLSPPR